MEPSTSGTSRRDQNQEIPGFYRDPKTGRYYKLDSFAPLPKRLRTEYQQEEPNPVLERPQHLPQLLYQRQTGILKKQSFESSLYNSTVKNLKWIGPRALAPWNQRFQGAVNISLLKGGLDKILALWNVHDDLCNYDVIGQITLPKFEPPRVDSGYFRVIKGVVDFSYFREPSVYIVYVTNNSYNGRGEMHIGFEENENRIIDYLQAPIQLPYTVFCCSGSNARKSFAIGGEGSICIYFAESHPFYTLPGRHLPMLQLKGNIHAIDWDPSGYLLYIGLHNGGVRCIDLRKHEIIFGRSLFDVGFNDIKCMLEEHYLVCSAFDGSLCKFDLRMHKKVVDFLGNKTGVKKSPISISERVNMLCATGSDNITRIWNLNGGNPLREFQPPEPYGPHLSCLLDNPISTKLGCIQEQNFYYSSVLSDC